MKNTLSQVNVSLCFPGLTSEFEVNSAFFPFLQRVGAEAVDPMWSRLITKYSGQMLFRLIAASSLKVETEPPFQPSSSNPRNGHNVSL